MDEGGAADWSGRRTVTRFEIEHASLTDVGVRRSHNQDNYMVQVAADEETWRQRGDLFLVADGMGAHAVGEKASEQAVAEIPHIYNKLARDGPVSALRRAFVEANAKIHACGQANREFEGMGTTSTALLLRPEGAWIGHVGDSRVYRIRHGSIEQLSYDHSLVWEYARLKRIDPDEVDDIPSNVIHRCLGPEPLVKVDIEGPHPLMDGDVFLLCSDGLSGQVSDGEIGAVVSVLPPAEACRFLVDLANLRGGPDNITVLIARVLSGAPPTPQSRVTVPLLDRIPRWLRIPWWAAALGGGTLLTVLAVVLHILRHDEKIIVFLLALVAILAGLVGLGIHYLREQDAPDVDDDQPRPRIHRQHACKVDSGLIERVAAAVKSLAQQADEKHWEGDWTEYRQHLEQGEHLLKKGDLDAAFREHCRAMMPLTRAVNKHRNKEEAFTPVWDKSR
jgi:protein phosphatase